ncbi:WD40-repeat-containing domain protein [Syncephalis plumigaleata]|nr:WD40-repeat-containing domain protein [Syncephalis plumigaleata]
MTVQPHATTDLLQVVQPIVQLCDWILDVQWIYADDDMECKKAPVKLAIIYAHNFVEIWSYPEMKQLHRVYCEEKCLLYASRFYGHHLSTLNLAVGTVFNKILLWSPCARLDNNDNDDSTVDVQLVGHEGVAFKLRFSPDGQHLASVSDDRTIRIWSLMDTKKAPTVLFGHQARIWDCQFIDDLLISVSEDCTCVVWKMEENGEDSRRIAVWDGHYTKNAWCLAVNPSRTLVVTGGDDGGIRVWPLASVKDQLIDSSDQMQPVVLPDPSKYCLNGSLSKEVASKEGIRNFVYIHPGMIIVSTFSGYILRYALYEDTWHSIYQDAALISYCMMTASPDGSFIVCGSITGQLTLLAIEDNEQPLQQWKPHTEKIFDIYILQTNHNESVYDILSITWLGDLVWYRYDRVNNTLIPRAKLVPPPHTVVVSVDIDPTEQLLVCGSREGALLVYDLSSIPSEYNADTAIVAIQPVWELRRSHGRNAVTTVAFRRQPGTEELVVWSTGRDGAYAQWRVHQALVTHEHTSDSDSKEERTIRLERIFYSKVTKGWLERIYFMDNQVLLGGFFQKRFFLYNETRHYEMLSVACGGSHRRWRFLIGNAKLENTVFSFMRMEKVLVYSVTQSAELSIPPKLQGNLHGREIRTIQWINMKEHPILLSGGEDGYLCLSHLITNTHDMSIVPYCRIKAHSSVIRASALSDHDNLSPLLVTCGGADELRVWRVHIESTTATDDITLGKQTLPAISVYELSSCPSTNVPFEIRIMDVCVFSLQQFFTERNTDHPIKSKSTDTTHIITAVYSDAFVRIWAFSDTTKSWQCLAQSDEHQKCILSCTMIWYNGHPLLITGATNGSVYVWDITTVLTSHYEDQCNDNDASIADDVVHLHPLLKMPSLHQSGVNCLDATIMQSSSSSSSIFIATGGDDNALHVVELVAIKDNPCQLAIKQMIHEPNAHASALQGCQFLTSCNGLLVTVAWDLRLQWWQLTETSATSIECIPQPFGSCLSQDRRHELMERHVKPADATTSLALVHSTVLNVTDPSALTILDTSVMNTSDQRSIHHDNDDTSLSSPLLAIAGMGVQVVRMTSTTRSVTAGLPS